MSKSKELNQLVAELAHLEAKMVNKTELPSRFAEVLEVGVDFDSRTIYLDSVVEEKTFRLVQACRMLDEAKGEITVVINSYGGEEDSGLALYDTLRSCRNTVTTIAISKAYSIAALILQAGDTRLATANAQIMIHNGTLSLPEIDVTKKDINDLLEKTSKSNRNYQRLLSEATGTSISQVKKWCSKDTYFSAEEALKLNFIDKIIQQKPKRKRK